MKSFNYLKVTKLDDIGNRSIIIYNSIMIRNTTAKILITGGHLTPAIATINELRKRGYNKIYWVGHRHNQAGNKKLSPEYLTITGQKIPFFNLKTGKLIRNWEFSTFFYGIKQLALIPIGFANALIIVIKVRPKIIVSFGGFLALPVVFWGRILGRKIVTHEQTLVLGLANKIIAKLSNKILVSWESSLKYFPQYKTVLTGNPIRRDILIIKSNTLTLDLDKSKPTILILGGNQGSHEINSKVFEIVQKLLEDFNVIHQTGNSSVTGDYTKANEIRSALSNSVKFNYLVKDFINQEEIGEALSIASIVVSRGGANTISEFMALGKMAIIIPLPKSSYSEQIKNAVMLEQTGLGYYLPQEDNLKSEKLYQTILMGYNQFKAGKGFNNLPIEECAKNALSMINLDAPSKVVDEIENLLK